MLHIGQDLHDSVGQKLTLASLYTQQIDYNNKHPELKEKIFDVSNIINESLDELRSISKNLTASNFSSTSFYNLIVAECNRIKKLGKCAIHLSHTNAEHLDINNHSKTLLLRIVQESLSNCLKHSNCNNINIDISVANELLKIVIKDDGVGFNTNAINNNVGLKSMHNRIKILEGNIDIQSQPGKGTKTFILVDEKKIM
jgi:signal transduction histidine kinase